VTVEAQFTIHEEGLGANIAFAGTSGTDGSGLKQAITALVQIEGNAGTIARDVPNDNDWWREYNDIATLSAGVVVDMKVTYDGTTVTYRYMADGELLLEKSSVPPLTFDQFEIAVHNLRWDTPAELVTLNSLNIYQGEPGDRVVVKPALQVLAVNGPMMIIALQSPYDSSTLSLEGGGLFNHARVEHENGTEFEMRSLIMNADMPTWNYRIYLRNGRTGEYITDITVHWDAETKTVEIPSEQGSVDALNDPERKEVVAALNAQLDKQASIDTLWVDFASLRSVQRYHLYEQSKFFIDDELQEEIIRRFPIPDHPDRNGIYHQLAAAWETAVGELLESAVNISVAAWQGESQQEAIEYLEWNYGRISVLRYLTEFAIDFRMPLPSKNEIQDEGIRIASAYVNGLLDHQAKNVKMLDREQNILEQQGEPDEPEEGDGAEGGTGDSTSEVLSEQFTITNITIGPVTGVVTTYVSGTTTVEILRTDYSKIEQLTDLPPGIWIIGHRFLLFDDKWHTAIFMKSDDPSGITLGSSNLKGDWMVFGAEGIYQPDTKNFTEVIYQIYRYYTLESEFNRPTDLPTHTKNELMGHVSLPEGLSINDAIHSIVAADNIYNLSLPAPYDFIPSGEGGYNSNSFVSGILQKANLVAPVLPPHINAPGYHKPLPVPYSP